jgi:hypothetical protein
MKTIIGSSYRRYGFSFPRWFIYLFILIVFLTSPRVSLGQISPGPPPDLIVENLRFLPENPRVGDEATFSFVVRNIGGGAAPTAKGQISGLPTPFSVDGFLTNPLGSGQSQSFSYPARLTAQSPGNYQVGVQINLPPLFAEVTPQNNYRAIQVTIAPPFLRLPDLAVSLFEIRPSPISKNGGARISIEIKNLGWVSSPPTQLRFGGEVKVKYFFGMPDSMPVPALGANQTWSVHFDRIHRDQFFPRPGDFIVTALVNPEGTTFNERTLDNNSRNLLVKVEDRLEANVPPPSIREQMEQKMQREHRMENLPQPPIPPAPRPGPPPPVSPKSQPGQQKGLN